MEEVHFSRQRWDRSIEGAKIIHIPSKYDQLQCDNEGKKCVDAIREHYKDNPYGF